MKQQPSPELKAIPGGIIDGRARALPDLGETRFKLTSEDVDSFLQGGFAVIVEGDYAVKASTDHPIKQITETARAAVAIEKSTQEPVGKFEIDVPSRFRDFAASILRRRLARSTVKYIPGFHPEQ